VGLVIYFGRGFFEETRLMYCPLVDVTVPGVFFTFSMPDLFHLVIVINSVRYFNYIN
jgi:hypothetical protein